MFAWGLLILLRVLATVKSVLSQRGQGRIISDIGPSVSISNILVDCDENLRLQMDAGQEANVNSGNKSHSERVQEGV